MRAAASHGTLRTHTTCAGFLWSAATLLLLIATSARAQEIEPRLYSNAPVGVNFVVAGFAGTQGGVAFDATSPLSKPELTTNSAILGYVRTLDLWGTSGKVDVVVPYTWLSGSADFAGERVHRSVNGFGDPLFRLSVNLVGAPALSAQEFARYQQDLVVGAALQVSAPLGQYDDTRLVNLGLNRWSFEPSLGVSKALGPWTLEATGSVTFYTDNDDYYQGSIREQAPLYSVQGNVVYSFRSGIWGAIGATYFTGGRTTIDGVAKDDLKSNWRVGVTLAIPVNRRNSFKAYALDGVAARTGEDFFLYGVAWQYRWGGGL